MEKETVVERKGFVCACTWTHGPSPKEHSLFHLQGLCVAHGQEAPGALLPAGMGEYPHVSDRGN